MRFIAPVLVYFIVRIRIEKKNKYKQLCEERKNENENENEKKTQKECKKAEKRREKEVAFMEQNKLTHVQI